MVMHDPFAMRPFFSYNFGNYLEHWLSMEQPGRTMPKIFNVNWFLKDSAGKFLWPGFGENARVLDWVCRRVDGEDCASSTAIGHVPKPDSLNMEGLKGNIDMQALFDVPKDFWIKEAEEIGNYFEQQVNVDLPPKIGNQLNELKERLRKM